ncbi:FHA domain-containing protein [Gilvimarinus sp. SDUM040013]|uniref:FHA domain-containing protein n=1 Tax=Gilvimarinus gilvus TaxID=3058038 RepID=A0ABU4S1H7_9GAMM|nr:FHA domain-containing protein [Gilvimarinus sp. SDUM040013]MDO3386118.1 FHA domain-containing protein [Gilvimarinus sp. SDUM040013]MDX6850341.1 FHA domain-containing protein [Gilvimarinus sp. SDUM040013]
MLKIKRQDKPHPPVLIVEKLYSIGTAADNNLVLKEPDIDSVHARLVNTNGQITLKDNTSSSGCFVNGQRITQKLLQPGDFIKIGCAEFEVLPLTQTDRQAQADDCWHLVADSSWLAGQSFIIAKDSRCIIGRSSECDITIAGTHLSRRHTEVSVVGSSLRVRDLGSANGTFVNERPVKDDLAHNGDQLRVDVYSFRIVGPDDGADKTQIRNSPLPEFTKTVERKTTSAEPKRWKTRPTSPGNRMEPTYRESRGIRLWPWVALCAAALSILLFLLLR